MRSLEFLSTVPLKEVTDLKAPFSFHKMKYLEVSKSVKLSLKYFFKFYSHLKFWKTFNFCADLTIFMTETFERFRMCVSFM